MNDQLMQWHGVPLDRLSAWDAIFIPSKESLNLSAPCPVCGNRTLHRYYSVYKMEEKIILGNRFVATGGLWEWCSSCRSYDHLSALVPDWWVDSLLIDSATLQALTPQPEVLEQALVSQRRWSRPLPP